MPRHSISRLSGLIVFAVAVLLLLGRMLGKPELLALLPGGQRMGLLNMVLLACAGAAIASLAEGWAQLGLGRRLVQIASMAVLVILPLGFLLETLLDIPLGLDMPPPGLRPSALNLHPGRTAPNSALAFLALDVALLCLTWPRRRLRASVGFAAVLVLGAIGGTALTGHALGLDDLYQLAGFNRMLPVTAVLLCLCAVGLWPLVEQDDATAVAPAAARARLGAEGKVERQINRRSAGLFALVTVVGGVAGFAVLRGSFEEASARTLLLTARTTATSIASEIDANLWYPKVIVARSSVRSAIAKLDRDEGRAGAGSASVASNADALARLAERFFNDKVTGAQFLDSNGAVLFSSGTLSIGQASVKHVLSESAGGAILFWADGYVLETRNDVVEDGRMVGMLVVETRLPHIHELLGEVQESGPTTDTALCSTGAGATAGALVCGPTRARPRGFTQPLQADPASVPGTLAQALRGQSGSRFVSDTWEADSSDGATLTGTGSNVISAFTPVKDFGLAVGVRSQVESLYAPLRGRVLQLLVVLAAVVGAGTLILRSQVRPLVTALGREQRRAARILENCNDGFIALDSQGRITDWNAQATRLFGWSAAQALGRPFTSLALPPASRQAFDAALADCEVDALSNVLGDAGAEGAADADSDGIDDGGSAGRRIELEAQHRDGRALQLELSLKTQPSDEGQLAHVFVQDVSARRAAEAAMRQSEQRLRLIAHNLPALVSYIDRDFRYRFCNQHYQLWFGLDQAALEGRTVAEVFGDDTFRGVRERIEAAFRGEDVVFELHHPIEGGPDHLLVHYIPDRDAHGRVIGVIGMVLDQSAQREAQARLEASERQLRAVTDNLPVLISYVDPEEKLVFLNGTFRDWLGIELEHALRRPMAQVLGDELYGQRREPMRRALAGERQEFDVESRTRRGRRHLHTIYIPDLREDGAVRGVFTLSMDVTRLKLVEEELRNLSTLDALTGLPNRRQLDDRLGLALARHQRDGAPLALMFLDVDHFKQINDSHGHAAGDSVLRELAGRLSTAVRDSDTVARLAGDEFIIIIEGMKEPGDAEQVAAKILESVRLPFQLEHQTLAVTTSIGVAICTGVRYTIGWGDGVMGPRAGDIGELTRARLMEAADRALYRAKQAGRDCVETEVLGAAQALPQLP